MVNTPDDENLLVKEHMNLVMRIAGRFYSMSHSVNGMNFDDVVQFGSMGLLAAIRDHDNQYDGFRTFAARYIRYAIVDGIRQVGGDSRSKFRACFVNDDDIDITGVDMSDRFLSMMFSDRLKSIVQSLPERSRQVIESIYYNGMTGREVANELGIGESAVSQRHHKGIKKLRELCGETEDRC